MKINKDYFIISKKIENIRYFLSQGNLYKHLLDRFYWYLCPRLKWTSHFPKHIDIETSSACQMKCPMCARHLMDNILTGNMDFDLYKRIVDECTREKVYSIKLSWRGEPLLNPKIVEMVTYAKKMGIPNVAFLSNGEPLNNEIIEDLDNGAYIYVCGATAMGSDVHDALVNILKNHHGKKMTESQAIAYLADLQKKGRYVQELWTA